jgi:2-keto-3-deoxy-6-phosphogluconate aldolase
MDEQIGNVGIMNVGSRIVRPRLRRVLATGAVLVVGAGILTACNPRVTSQGCNTATVTFEAPADGTYVAAAYPADNLGGAGILSNAGARVRNGDTGSVTIGGLATGSTYVARVFPVTGGLVDGSPPIVGYIQPVGPPTPPFVATCGS